MAVITISREYGAGGNPIAGLLCERLGYRFFDKNLMEQLGAPETLNSVLANAETTADVHDEHGPLWRFFRNLQASSPIGEREGLAREGELPFQAVEELIRQAYDADNVVVVGRGGQMVLRGRPGVLHIRVIAPLEQRIPIVAQFDGLPLDAARDRVLGRDRAAAAYVRQYYNADIADPCLYDMVIKTAQLSWEAGTDTIVTALKHISPRSK